MNMLMIDLETLSLEQNAAIASIGLVAFNKKEVVAKKQIDVCLESCQEVGLHISASTVVWWMGQSDSAIKNTFSGKERQKISSALSLTNQFYEENECDNVYGNGAVADLVWMKNAYRSCGMMPPWKFWNELCYRTIRSNMPILDSFSPTGTAHVAVDDAENQARYLIQVMNEAGFW